MTMVLFAAGGMRQHFEVRDVYHWIGRQVVERDLSLAKVSQIIRDYELRADLAHRALRDARELRNMIATCLSE